MAKLRVLELFSGIGGMHSACQLVEAVLSQPLGILRDFPDIYSLDTVRSLIFSRDFLVFFATCAFLRVMIDKEGPLS